MPTSAPAKPAWHARSFYALIIGLLIQVAALFGFDLLAWAELGDEDVVTDRLYTFVNGGIMLWIWLERRFPKFSLVFSSSATARSPAFVGLAAAALAALALSGCERFARVVTINVAALQEEIAAMTGYPPERQCSVFLTAEAASPLLGARARAQMAAAGIDADLCRPAEDPAEDFAEDLAPEA